MILQVNPATEPPRETPTELSIAFTNCMASIAAAGREVLGITNRGEGSDVQRNNNRILKGGVVIPLIIPDVP